MEKEQFKKYSKYYDNVYQNKDYGSEALFVFNLLKKYNTKKVARLLSLGCGTGSYEFLLANKVPHVVGVDMSKEMLRIAHNKQKEKQVKNIDFRCGDVRHIRLKERFDSVVAMFNIIGYQNKDEDVKNFLKTVGLHLKSGGLFIFDGWYQPAVLKDRPVDREKKIVLDKNHYLLRKTKQKLDIENGMLYIAFELEEFVSGEVVNKVSESHPMRFFTLNEIKFFLEDSGFKLVTANKFMSLDVPISEKFWDMIIVAKKD